MSNDGLRGFIKKNEDVLNTTGHIVSYVQSRKIQANQENLARLEQINLSLLNKQNEIKEKELEKLEELKNLHQKEKELELKRSKIKGELLEIAPKTKGLITFLENENELNNFEKFFLIRHTEVSLNEISQNKSVIEDINFHDYFFELKLRYDKLIEQCEYNNDVLRNKGDILARKLLEIENFLVSTELISKDLKDIYVEKDDLTEVFLRNLVANIKNDLQKKTLFLDIQESLLAYQKVEKVILKYDNPYKAKRYFNPISFFEVNNLIQNITYVLDDEQEYMSVVREKIEFALKLEKKEHKPVINRFEEILNKKWVNISYDDLQFIEQNIRYENISFFKEEFEKKVSKLRDALEKEEEQLLHLKKFEFSTIIRGLEELEFNYKMIVQEELDLKNRSNPTKITFDSIDLKKFKASINKLTFFYIPLIFSVLILGVIAGISIGFGFSIAIILLPSILIISITLKKQDSIKQEEMNQILYTVQNSLVLTRNIISKL